MFAFLRDAFGINNEDVDDGEKKKKDMDAALALDSDGNLVMAPTPSAEAEGQSRSGEGDLPVVDDPSVGKKLKLYSGDRVVKFEGGQAVFGFVEINSLTKAVRIDWDGVTEYLDGGVLNDKIGILDRQLNGFGSRVTKKEDGRTGQVKEKRFLVTCTVKNDYGVVLKDLPLDSLIRPDSAKTKKFDKVSYKDEWVGMLLAAKKEMTFKMEADGTMGTTQVLSSEAVGDLLPRMTMAHLWDASWKNDYTWAWNFLKNLGNTARIVGVGVDSVSIAWMGNPQGSVAMPPNILTKDEAAKVEHLYGRNWRYVMEYESWNYDLKETDKEIVMTYAEWVKNLASSSLFFGEDSEEEEFEGLEGNVEAILDKVGSLIPVRIVSCRSLLDVVWDDDGSTERGIEAHTLEPASFEPSASDPGVYLYAYGDIVQRSVPRPNCYSEYGLVTQVTPRQVSVKWVHRTHKDPVAVVTHHDYGDVRPHKDFKFLKQLAQIPVVVVQDEDDDDGPRLGVAVGVNVDKGKIIVKFPKREEDEGWREEEAVWPHDLKHFEGDVMVDLFHSKFVPWTDAGVTPNTATFTKGSWEEVSKTFATVGIDIPKEKV